LTAEKVPAPGFQTCCRTGWPVAGLITGTWQTADEVPVEPGQDPLLLPAAMSLKLAG
jgi:hypothetical protein